MTLFEKLLTTISAKPIAVLDNEISFSKYTLLNLSNKNKDLEVLNMGNPKVCQSYIDGVLKQNNALVAYGGYLEERSLYANNAHFNAQGEELRSIHLGVDFWEKAGTKVQVPVSGIVHSFKNNAVKGDYGPTIILSHEIQGVQFYTLYGHLSLESLDGLYVGKKFSQGDTLATLGTPEVNVNYAPHLHFQIIQDVGTNYGDYPGVCTASNQNYYIQNCPNPALLLKV